MGKRIIFHLFAALLLGSIYYFVYDGADVASVFIFALTYLFFSAVLDFLLHRRKKTGNNKQITTVEPEKVAALIEAVGGKENIVSSAFESSRVKIGIRDADLINKDDLEKIAVDGAYLSGNQLQMTFGASSGDFSRQITNFIS